MEKKQEESSFFKERDMEEIKEIREKIVQQSLHIARVPKRVYKEFTALAKEEFCSDYGLCLKHIWDFYNGLISTGIEHLEDGLERAFVEIEVMKSVVFKPEEKKVRRRLDGSVSHS